MSSYYSYGNDGGPDRWDRERFERVRARSRGPPERERERFEYDEYDRYGPRGDDRRDIRVSVDERGPRGRYDERVDIVEEDRFSPRRSRPPPGWADEERIRITERDRQVAPYRPRYEERERERDIYYDGPGYDRDRPRPRYDDNQERDVNVSINVKAPEYYPPPRDRRDYYEEDDYKGARIFREREVFRDRRESEEIDIYEEDVSSPRRRKIKSSTRCPKRLFHKRALVELGYPFREDEFFWFIPYEISQGEIDDLRTLSTTYFEEEIKISLTKTKLIEAPNPPAEAEPPAEIVETVTTKIIENPTEEDIKKYGSAPSISVSKSGKSNTGASDSGGSVSPGQSITEENISIHNSIHESVRRTSGSAQISRSVAETLRSPSPGRHGHRGRSRSRAKGSEIFEEDRTIVIDSPMDLIVTPESRKASRRERDIKAEIRALEAEKKALKYEREADEKRDKADRIREGGVEIDIRERNEVRVEKDNRERERSTERSQGLMVREPSHRRRSRSIRISKQRSNSKSKSRSRSRSRSRSPASRKKSLAKGLAFFTT